MCTCYNLVFSPLPWTWKVHYWLTATPNALKNKLKTAIYKWFALSSVLNIIYAGNIVWKNRSAPCIFCLPHRTQNRAEQWLAYMHILFCLCVCICLCLCLWLFSSFSKINTCTTPEFKCLHRIGRRYGIFSKTICFGQLPTQFLGPGIQNLKTRLVGNLRNLNNQVWDP